MTKLRKFIDIGANLTDIMYSGFYNGSKKHESDLDQVLARSWKVGLDRIIITGGSVDESAKAIELSKTDERLYATVGCHPTRCLEFEEDPNSYLEKLKKLIEDNKEKVVAIGECGLDYDRLQFCPKEQQQKYFKQQLKLVDIFHLPLFLHCRNAAADLYNILKNHNYAGVVHSFDGTIEEAEQFISLGYFIGLNGCSLKTDANLETVKKLPVDRILIETDSPWCDIRPAHAGFKFISKESQDIPSVKKEKWKEGHLIKSRNEPCNIRQVLDVVASVKEEDPSQLSEQIYCNTVNLFFPNSK